jgi:hypothetical protein
MLVPEIAIRKVPALAPFEGTMMLVACPLLRVSTPRLMRAPLSVALQ